MSRPLSRKDEILIDALIAGLLGAATAIIYIAAWLVVNGYANAPIR